MSAGYGRGYYGAAQLARPPKKRSWFTIVAVLGVGAAVVWLLWPKKAMPEFGPVDKEPERLPPAPVASTSPLVVIHTGNAPVAASMPPAFATGAFLKQLEDDARARGFITVKDYEDSVVASAKKLQAAGAKVMFAPHLQHLESQLGS
jgi:hypothetical protein